MAGTAAAGSFGHEGAGAGIGHHGGRVLVGAIVAMIALAVFPLPPENPASFALPLLLFVVVLGAWVLMRRHDRSLCERCVRTMPLDAAATAQRRHRRFAVVHLGARRGVVAGYLVVLLGSNALLFLESTPARLLWAAVQFSMVYLVLAHSTHRSLQPWCPWCSEGGGGEDVVDTPGPLPVGGTKVG
ncbi:hypothetical protein ACXR2U_06935 [Jatrophihabitans sp. YIM 134969]